MARLNIPALLPLPPPYDALEWDKKPFPEKCRLACEAWAVQGYGSPAAVVVAYALKLVAYVAAWALFCSSTPGLGDLRTIESWWLHPIAFQKAIVWSMLFELLGLGCGSGPLTGRYFPPFGGFLYFLYPGTIKLPLFPGAPVVGGRTRTWLDVALTFATYVFLVRALLAAEPTVAHLAPIAVLVPILGVTDKTLFLAARGEHYYLTVLCFVLAGDSIERWIAGAMAVQLALWLWAGVSKLNHHFPAVVCVMISNGPFTRFDALRKRMYKRFPDDLRPSRLAEAMAHTGTALELAIPAVLVVGDGGVVTTIGLVMVIALHGFITSTVPMGVPIEWNAMVVYGAFFLFGAHADVSVLALGTSPSALVLAAILVVGLVVVPLVGNFFPTRVSFLLAMRYYAGNWPYSVWLFRHGSEKKLERLKKVSRWPTEQLALFYDEKTAVGLVGKVLAFRAMHLQGRVIQTALPLAVDRLDEYQYVDGELIAGLVVGWNFGDGHLHHESLLEAIQERCGFEEGELRCIFVEAQPLLGAAMSWRVVDAKSGARASGEAKIADLVALQPWPTA